ncbi:MAG: RNA polymerase sigma factor RpoH [Thermodesulfobacteriota bacterium]|jgi:RNA polymerase sigma-32 factor|nr:RNA polymerase sigma factor RpoH [Candidatus Dadabacteria bacterium]MCZ6527268.1 RNA polymerase sigma factor RpoH [Candidatus Dadabacteria bacterium]MCZ6555016.1 RNA polymerase sigma factor RpoH [Candidatus Dadabacteria bacterium]MCZ6638641.1 RNA polymerase sigma factor RpoH [Candidatus Dadabacteria bacterium]MCZ6685040.1 RNA polymerase sigma factor RpoH [Candidatus Dadabacteria bacterium]
MPKKTDKTDKTKEKRYQGNLLPAHTTSLQRYMTEISNYPVLSREEEYELAMKYKNDGDLDAARKLVTSNLKFVVKVANEYKNYGLNTMDIIQEGNVGLMHAVKGFDPTKGYRVISYAVWWIRAYIQNYIIKSWSLVKVGTTQAQRKLFYKLRSTKNQMEIGEGNLSSEDYKELADKLNVTYEAVIEMDQRMGSKDLSLDAEIKSDTNLSHMDFLADDEENQEDLITKVEEEKRVKSGMVDALKTLKDRERYIVENRILADKPLTLEELGTKYNISRERVRQIENAALKKMKSILKEKGISKSS